MATPVYDYVIVGAGSAGCVLAHRLSADPDVRVLLIEAGPRDRNWKIHVPAAFPKLFKTRIDWAFHTEPEPDLDGRRLYWPRGKVLGGSSSINAMVYIRGHHRDYDRWRDLGNPSWAWDDVLPYFRRSQHQNRGASELHGTGGPLHVSDQLEPTPAALAFVAAGEELGWPRNDDFNGPHQTGVGLYQVTQKSGRRCSAAAAYLTPVRQRPNLTVKTGALATKVLIEGQRATGVELRTVFGSRRLYAEREVILAAGAVGSPHLLLLSGIGPSESLRRHGLPVVADLAGVGRNLQDHVLVSVVFRTREDVGLDHSETLGNLIRYLLHQQGPYTSNVCEGGAFVRTVPDRELPDLQFHFLPTAITDHGFGEPTDQGINFGPTLLRPKSVGDISLRTSDPTDPPQIRANYLHHPADLKVLMEGVRLSRRLAETQALSAHIDFEVLPGNDTTTDEEIAAFVRRSAQTLYHPVGTCRMGPAAELSANPEDGLPPPVVDAELKVHGVDGLRVADASIMPEIIGGNTNAPAMMIAEKAADMILGK